MMPKLPAAPADAGPRTFADRVRTLTPVVLTVVATVLAGISSSEMSLAQYHRALAAQDQSRSGDQWAFFQAKRTRTTILEQSIDLAPAPAAPVQAERLQTASTLLETTLHSIAGDASRLRQTAPASGDDTSLHQAADALASVVQHAQQEVHSARADLDRALTHAEVRQALTYLGTRRLPGGAGPLWDDAEVSEAVRLVQAHAADEELAPRLLPLGEVRIDACFRSAQAKIDAVDQATRTVDRALAEVDALLRRQRAAAGACQRAAGEVTAVAAELTPPPDAVRTAGGTKPPSAGATAKPEASLEALRAAAAAVTRRARALRRSAQELAAYQVARDDYTARRLDREADLNRQVAGLYDVRVRLSGAASERHRRRSRQFFYGMLCAQAGVAVASFSLAARHPGGLWGLAGFAGLAAVLFSAYVYLYV